MMPMSGILVMGIVATVSHPSTHYCSRAGHHLPYYPLPGLKLGAWCLPGARANWKQTFIPLSGTGQAFPSLAVASQERAFWRQGQRLACSGCFPAALARLGLQGPGRGQDDPSL